MLLEVEKKGKHWVITNKLAIKYKKFVVQVDENDIVSNENQILNHLKVNENVQEILDIRKKYSHLKVIDHLTSTWMVNENDDELLQRYFKKRAEDEGII